MTQFYKSLGVMSIIFGTKPQAGTQYRPCNIKGSRRLEAPILFQKKIDQDTVAIRADDERSQQIALNAAAVSPVLGINHTNKRTCMSAQRRRLWGRVQCGLWNRRNVGCDYARLSPAAELSAWLRFLDHTFKAH